MRAGYEPCARNTASPPKRRLASSCASRCHAGSSTSFAQGAQQRPARSSPHRVTEHAQPQFFGAFMSPTAHVMAPLLRGTPRQHQADQHRSCGLHSSPLHAVPTRNPFFGAIAAVFCQPARSPRNCHLWTAYIARSSVGVFRGGACSTARGWAAGSLASPCLPSCYSPRSVDCALAYAWDAIYCEPLWLARRARNSVFSVSS